MSNMLSLSAILTPRRKKPQPKVIKRPQHVPISAEDRQQAIEAVRQGGNISKIAREFGIARTTLHDAAFKGTRQHSGRAPVLPANIETRIADWISTMGNIGYGQKQEDVLDKVQELVLALNITTPWKNGRPSRRWFQLFKGRHPEITSRMSMVLSRERAVITNDDLQNWFQELRQYMVTVGHPYIFDDPTRLYNADETGFSLAPPSGKVLVNKNQGHHTYQAGYPSTKQQITVLLCASASGHYTRPLVVYAGVLPRVDLREHFHRTFPEGIFGNTESGWMDGKLFAEWLETGFDADITRRNVTKPVILFVDGAKVHISIEAAEYCSTNGIYLYVLYPNSTHITQPLDLAFNGSIKSNYRQEMRQWIFDNMGEHYDKYHFIEVFVKTFNKSATVRNAAAGFEKAGLYPWDPSKVDTVKLFASKLYDPREEANRPLPPIPDTDENTSGQQEETSGFQEAQPSTSGIQANTSGIQLNTSAEAGISDEIPATPDGQAPITSTPKSSEEKKTSPKMIQVDGEWFELRPMRSQSREEMLDEALKIPKVRQKVAKKLGPARVPGLNRCVSSEAWIKKYKDAKEAKEAQEEAVEKRKEERRLNAEKKKLEKAAKEAARKEKIEGKRMGQKSSAKGQKSSEAVTKRSKRTIKRRKFADETSSEDEDEDEVMYADSSSDASEDEYDVLAMRCSECDTRFKRDERREAIGCDSAHCGRWYHPKCTDLDTEGRTEDEIRAIDFTCKYC